MPAIDAGISVATGGTCLGAAGVLFVADRLPWINKLAGRIKSPQIQAVLVLTASIGLISTPVGQFLNRMVTLVDGAVSGIVGQYTGVGISFALALSALLWLVSDFATGVQPRTLLLAAITPFLAVMIPGSLGEGAAGALGFIATQVGSLIGLLLGM
ncbi:hypothetical protein [Streptomyces virginiae]|uniref:hypothetical protein n=1 Tax=Streptomyces virginiae TaxID=1961 RepID=UPI00341F3F88